jgi:hypothetical protein
MYDILQGLSNITYIGPATINIGRRSARRECLDHVLIFHEKQVYRVLRAYVDYFYLTRPHQGISRQGRYLRFTRAWNTKHLCSDPG